MLAINTNMSSLNAQRSITSTQEARQTAMERLTTGLRINQAKDDAAGLAISESMTSQIRGGNQAIRNVNDAISVAQTADGGIGELASMVQRLRVLAVQAANGTNTGEQRSYLNTEASQLLTEINAVTDGLKFNSMPLLDGTFNKNMAIGVDGETSNLTIGGLDAVDLGLVDNTEHIIHSSIDNFVNFVGQTINFTLEGVAISFTATGTGDQAGNAAALKSALDSNSAALSTAGISYALNSNGTGIDITMNKSLGGESLDLSNYSITQDLLAMEAAGVITATPATNGSFESGMTGWNVNTSFSGLPGDNPSGTPTQTATIDSTTSTVGSNSLKMSISGSVSVPFGTAHGPEVTSDTFSAKAGDLLAIDWKALDSGDDYDIYLYIENVDTGDKQQVLYRRGDYQDWTSTTATIPFTGDNLRFSFLAGSYDATGGQAIGSTLYIDNVRTLPRPDNSLDFTAGVNESGTETLSYDNTGAAIIKREDYNIVTTDLATLSIPACDHALDLLMNERAKIGAFQNRMEHRSQSLQNMVENISASRSRILDADYAIESADLARTDVLQQAGMAMLSQANQFPQQVLSLLR